jgi:hypothetical protein
MLYSVVPMLIFGQPIGYVFREEVSEQYKQSHFKSISHEGIPRLHFLLDDIDP